MFPQRLRLRVDPPYPGEALTSFLGRAAQTYGVPLSDLLRQLTQQSLSKGGRRDLDRWPSNALLGALSDAVPGWSFSPEGLGGFRSWVLSPTARHTYCPTCFVEDLAAQRVPYFRQDWMAVLTTTCWEHGTPLYQWRWIKSGLRTLPKAWMFQAAFGVETYPAFFQADLAGLQNLREASANTSDAGPELLQALNLLHRLQQLLEKPAAQMMPAYVEIPNIEWSLQNSVRRLCLLATSFSGNRRVCPMAAALRPPMFGDWFGAPPPSLRPRQYEYREFALRIAGDVAWRRTYLWFVARTLAGCQPFADSLFQEFQPWEPWEAWWARDVWRLCPAAFWQDIDFEANLLRNRAPAHCRDLAA